MKEKVRCNLDAIIEEKNTTRAWVAEDTGISMQLLSSYCNGKSIPNVHNAIKISDTLGVDVRDIWPVEYVILPKKVS